MESQDWAALWDRADAAGRARAAACVPEPMYVVEHSNPWDDSSPITRAYAPVMEGACGFGWVSLRPATSSFVRWLRANDIGRRDSYAGGWMIWSPLMTQSLERNAAWADGAAEVLREAGFNASGRSRID